MCNNEGDAPGFLIQPLWGYPGRKPALAIVLFSTVSGITTEMKTADYADVADKREVVAGGGFIFPGNTLSCLSC